MELILTEVKTSELVKELKQREGVEVHTVEPYQGVSVNVEGPAVVLVIQD